MNGLNLMPFGDLSTFFYQASGHCPAGLSELSFFIYTELMKQ